MENLTIQTFISADAALKSRQTKHGKGTFTLTDEQLAALGEDDLSSVREIIVNNRTLNLYTAPATWEAVLEGLKDVSDDRAKRAAERAAQAARDEAEYLAQTVTRPENWEGRCGDRTDPLTVCRAYLPSESYTQWTPAMKAHKAMLEAQADAITAEMRAAEVQKMREASWSELVVRGEGGWTTSRFADRRKGFSAETLERWNEANKEAQRRTAEHAAEKEARKDKALKDMEAYALTNGTLARAVREGYDVTETAARHLLGDVVDALSKNAKLEAQFEYGSEAYRLASWDVRSAPTEYAFGVSDWLTTAAANMTLPACAKLNVGRVVRFDAGSDEDDPETENPVTAVIVTLEFDERIHPTIHMVFRAEPPTIHMVFRAEPLPTTPPFRPRASATAPAWGSSRWRPLS